MIVKKKVKKERNLDGQNVTWTLVGTKTVFHYGVYGVFEELSLVR